MAKPASKSAEEARNHLPDLLTAAENSRSTVITKHGRPVAAIVPMADFTAGYRQQSLIPVKGSGRGLWGQNNVQNLRELRDDATDRSVRFD